MGEENIDSGNSGAKPYPAATELCFDFFLQVYGWMRCKGSDILILKTIAIEVGPLVGYSRREPKHSEGSKGYILGDIFGAETSNHVHRVVFLFTRVDRKA